MIELRKETQKQKAMCQKLGDDMWQKRNVCNGDKQCMIKLRKETKDKKAKCLGDMWRELAPKFKEKTIFDD